MSLALPRQEAGERASQVLPSVNCSTCHNPVPLVELGSHVCSARPLPKPSSSPSKPTHASSTSTASSISKWLPTRRPSKSALEPPLKPPPANLFGESQSGRRGSSSSSRSSSSNTSSSVAQRPPPEPQHRQQPLYGSAGAPASRLPPSRNQTLPPLSTNHSVSTSSSPHLPRPSISSSHAQTNPLPSPPLNPYQLRPSPNDHSPRSFNEAASSFHAPTPSYAGSFTTRTPSPIDYSGVQGSIVKTEVGGGAGMAGVGRRAFALATATNNHTLHALPVFNGKNSPGGSLSPASPYPPLPASSSGHSSQLSHGSHPSHGSQPSSSSASSHLPTASVSPRPPRPSRQPSSTSSTGSWNAESSERKPQNKAPFLEKYQELVRGTSQSSTKGLGLGSVRSGSSDGGRQSSDQGRRDVDAAEKQLHDEDSETELPWARTDADDRSTSIRSGLLHAVRETSSGSGSGSSNYSDPQTARQSEVPLGRPISPPLTSSVQSHSSKPSGSFSSHNPRTSGFRIEEEGGSDVEEEQQQPGARSVESLSLMLHKSGRPSNLMTPSTSLDRLTREELSARVAAEAKSDEGRGNAFQRIRGGSQGSSGSGSSGGSSGRMLGGMKTRLGVEGLEDLVEEMELTDEPLPISPTSDNDPDNLDGPVKKPSATRSASSSFFSRPIPPLTNAILPAAPLVPSLDRSRSPSPASHFHLPALTPSTALEGGLTVPGSSFSSRRKDCLQCGKEVGGRTGKKYVQMKEGEGVLCEEDWKSMYLPKCRRCALPIESRAISSADGQLKGKFHLACFTCYTCDKPFDGQTFWVHGSRPYCELDYHRVNNSLCASPTCGLPIEGSCAVIQTLKGEERFHAWCLRCADPSPSPCLNSLAEHFVLGDERFCSQHVGPAWERQRNSGVGRGVRTARPEKRRTLIVDLKSLGRV